MIKQEWKDLREIEQLNKIDELSYKKPVVLFKHSTRCGISNMALNRLQQDWDSQATGDADFYYLDLIAHRDISNKIAEEYRVIHQSPQLIIVKEGKAVYHTSHSGISFPVLVENLSKN